MAVVLKNNAKSQLASSLAVGATSLSVSPGTGANFPALSGGDWFPLTLVQGNGQLEVVKVTARSTDTMTIVRAQEGTVAMSFSAGDRVGLRLTAGAITDIETRLAGLAGSAQSTANSAVSVANSASSAAGTAQSAANAAQGTANAALPKAGGTMTGQIDLAGGSSITGDSTGGLRIITPTGSTFIGSRGLNVAHYEAPGGASSRLHYFYGQVQASSNITAYSDERVKANIERIPNALEKVRQIQGVTYDRTDMECARQTGVIAQAVQKVLPEAISINPESGHLYVAYGNMVGLLIEAVKELSEQVEVLKGERG